MTQNQQQEPVVQFHASSVVSVFGAISGAIIAVGVPAVVLGFGASVGPSAQVVLTAVGIGVGGLIALASAFFGLVLPKQVGGHGAERDKGE